jgi:hypothetical protein
MITVLEEVIVMACSTHEDERNAYRIILFESFVLIIFNSFCEDWGYDPMICSFMSMT